MLFTYMHSNQIYLLLLTHSFLVFRVLFSILFYLSSSFLLFVLSLSGNLKLIWLFIHECCLVGFVGFDRILCFCLLSRVSRNKKKICERKSCLEYGFLCCFSGCRRCYKFVLHFVKCLVV